jgi:hypothetical protein
MQYVFMILLQAPLLFLFAGATQRLRKSRHPFVRFQFIGSCFLLAGFLSRFIILGILDPYHQFEWIPWFERGETGAFWIGLLLLFLGVFLAHRPRQPGFRPWPKAGKVVSILFILICSMLAVGAWWWISLPWLNLPWGLSRLLFTAGLYPAALLYLLRSGRSLPPQDYLP